MNTTKVVSFRVPFTTYTELLALAKEYKMSLADYVLYLIHQGGAAAISKAENRVEQLSKEVEEHRQNMAVLRRQLEQANKDNTFLQKQIETQREALVSRHNEVIGDILEFYEKKDENSFSSYKSEIEYFEGKYW